MALKAGICRNRNYLRKSQYQFNEENYTSKKKKKKFEKSSKVCIRMKNDTHNCKKKKKIRCS